MYFAACSCKMIETLFGDAKQLSGAIYQAKLRFQSKEANVFTLAKLTVNLRRLL